MKIYVGHSKQSDYVKELYQPLRESTLNTMHEIILPHEEHENAVDFLTKELMKTCDLMIAEVSYPATGLGIEIGRADCFNIPILCIYKKGAKISGSLQLVSNHFVEYTDVEDMIENLQNALKVF